MTTPTPNINTVSMANELIRAAHNLSLMEKRVLMLAIAKIDSNAKSDVNSLIRLTVSEFISEFDIDKDSAYREVKKAAKGIRRRYARFFMVDTDGQPIERDIDWTTSGNYKDSEGWLELSINGDLNPYLFELKSHFTTYKLSRASALRSVYSWRLFELLMQFKKTGLLKINIDEFAKCLELSETYTSDFGAMRRKVIEPAVKEIREKDGLAIEWEAIKAGRKVKALKFTFPTEQQLILDTHPKALNSANTPRTEQQAEQGAKAKKGAKQEIEAFLSLSETKSRLQSAKELARLAKVPAETYLTEKDRASIAHYELTI